jgi:acetyl-CoA acyltransferase
MSAHKREIRTVGIVDFGRSPISKAKGGKLNELTVLDVATQVVRKLLDRNPKIPRDQIEHLTCGCAFPEAENGLNIARQIVIKAGLPECVAGSTVNQFCGSSQQSTMMLADAFAVGKGDIGISVGVEHMTRVPMGGYNPFYDKELKDKEFYLGMGLTAEKLARELEISREEQEQFAVDSHRKAIKAWKDGAFAKEVIPITLPDGSTLAQDECPQEPNIEKMKSLKPAFDEKGTLTAATCSPVSTGAAVIILMTEEKAKQLGLTLRVKIVTTAVAGCDPTRMGMGPIPASRKALERAGLSDAQIDVFELNEAFAAQSLYCIKKLGWDSKKINTLGGAIALGHPLGMSGARIIGTAITALERAKGRYALATMCVGGGQGVTTILERGE